MPIKDSFVPAYAKLSFAGTLTSENAYLRSRAGNFLLTLLVCVFIAAIAYADSRVQEISLGFLYVLPIALSGLVNRLPTSLFFAAVCVLLHDIFGPPHLVFPRILLNLFALVGFLIVILVVNRMKKESQALSSIVHQQHDELTREIQLATEVQQRLLPRETPQVEGVEIAAGINYYNEMGGDYYDFIKLPNGDLGISIADVSGKGTAAAMLMPAIGVGLRLEALNDQNTTQGFQNLNKVICEVTENSRFATLFYGHLRVSARKLEYINAGHCPPLLFRQKQNKSEWLEAVATPLGLFAEALYPRTVTEFESSDVLICYTDGLSEAENAYGRQFGKHEIARLAKLNAEKSAQKIYDAILRGVDNFRGDEKLSDDLTLIVLKIK